MDKNKNIINGMEWRWNFAKKKVLYNSFTKPRKKKVKKDE